MNGFEFLKYWLDTHPIMFGAVSIILALGVCSMLSNLFKDKNAWRADVEHEKQFWN